MFEWLESTRVALWVGESLWGYPFLLGMHVVGMSVAVGVFAMRDMRLMGLFEGIDYSALDSLQPLGWAGFVINAISGCFLFSSQAVTFAHSTPFLLKISMIFLAAITAAIIQNRMRNEAVAWDASGAAVGSIRLLALMSTTLWFGAIISGRLVAYL